MWGYFFPEPAISFVFSVANFFYIIKYDFKIPVIPKFDLYAPTFRAIENKSGPVQTTRAAITLYLLCERVDGTPEDHGEGIG
jgi:hypothetical protein